MTDSEVHRKAFKSSITRLGCIFSNLSEPSGATYVEWYRAFRDVPATVLEDAVGRAVERHDSPRLMPAAFRGFVDEALRDHRAARTLELDEAEPEVCKDPACERCAGEGRFVAEIEVGNARHAMTVICNGATDGESRGQDASE